MTEAEVPRSNLLFQNIALIGGPLACLLLLAFADLDPGKPEVTRTAAVGVLMAIWWISEAVPLAVTALLPMVLFPLLGVMNGKEVAPTYFNHIIFLFIGGFLMAMAMERWNLHKRIALRILLMFGVRPRRMLMGFMVATAFLSMWISNTATTMMMVPIAMAIIVQFKELLGEANVRKFAIGICLGIAYSASIGGTATLVGTPPNLSFVRILSISFPEAPEISFAQWFLFALPFAICFLVIVWSYLSYFFCPKEAPLDVQVFRQQYKELGRISFEEWVVLVLFVSLALLWLTRADIGLGVATIPGWSRLFPNPKFLNDGVVAVTVAVLLFVIPSRQESGSRIMKWDAIGRLPWHIIILFGGGFALASAFKVSGLSIWVGNALSGAANLHPILLIALICLCMTFLTELTSNTATTEMLLPILAGLALAIDVNPLLLMIPATLSCSCAFMLPVATPPNAIMFGTEQLSIRDMARAGFMLNLVGVVLITAAICLLGRLVFDIQLGTMPEWALAK